MNLVLLDLLEDACLLTGCIFTTAYLQGVFFSTAYFQCVCFTTLLIYRRYNLLTALIHTLLFYSVVLHLSMKNPY